MEERIYLNGSESIADLRGMGLPESTAHAARKRCQEEQRLGTSPMAGGLSLSRRL